MKGFQTIQKNIGAMGLTPSRQQNNRPQWNSRQIFCTVKYVIDTFAMGTYVIFEADDIEEYMESIFSLTAVVAIEASYISFIFKSDKLFGTFELVSKEITIRKLHFKMVQINFWILLMNSSILFRIK